MQFSNFANWHSLHSSAMPMFLPRLLLQCLFLFRNFSYCAYFDSALSPTLIIVIIHYLGGGGGGRVCGCVFEV
jgi:hypothetical protein